MTTIPTIATHEMLRGLTSWDPKMKSRWMTDLAKEAGRSLLTLSHEATSWEMGEGGDRQKEFEVNDWIPQKDVLRYVEEDDDSQSIPVLRWGSRSFHVGLAKVLDMKDKEVNRLLVCRESLRNELEEVTEKYKVFSGRCHRLPLVGGCGSPSDWLVSPDTGHCAALNNWWKWVDPDGGPTKKSCRWLCESGYWSGNPKWKGVDGPVKTWWELAQLMEDAYEELRAVKGGETKDVTEWISENNDALEELMEWDQDPKTWKETSDKLLEDYVNLEKICSNFEELSEELSEKTEKLADERNRVLEIAQKKDVRCKEANARILALEEENRLLREKLASTEEREREAQKVTNLIQSRMDQIVQLASGAGLRC